MFKHIIKYTDYDGNEQAETAYFNLTKLEMVKLQSSVEGGLDKAIEKINADKDAFKIFALFDKLIRASYGKKSEDGKVFRKTPELVEDFAQSAAYEALFNEFLENPNLLKDFFINCVPSDMKQTMATEFNKVESKSE